MKEKNTLPTIATDLTQSGLTDNATLAETGDPAYFLLNTPRGEVLIGLQLILQCLMFAEEQGLLPTHDYQWWRLTDDLYQCGHPIVAEDL